MSFFVRAFDSRWGWFLRGLPSLPRAKSMFRIRRATMTSPARCRLLWEQCGRIFQARLPGAFVECGVWRGGSTALMALAAQRAGKTREFHLFDSFAGLPEPSAADGAASIDYSGGKSSGRLEPIGKCVAGLNEVQQFLFDKLLLEKSWFHFHVGWFQNTIPAISSNIGDIALLRLDGDWYESTQICLEYLYPKLLPGGVVILDDYFAWKGCRDATEDYRTRHGIKTKLVHIDDAAGYWVKE
ncbi:MAG: TylF/MycF/NovP-related O-methyltransferase [Verrucomicrobiota bacterium]